MTCTFPNCWKMGQVTPIYKRGIEDEFELLIKNVEDKYYDVALELEIIKLRESIKSRHLGKGPEMYQICPADKKTLEKSNGINEQIKENDKMAEESKTEVDENKKQSESDSKKSPEEITDAAEVKNDGASCSDQLEKCQSLIGELQRQMEVLESKQKTRSEEDAKRQNEKEKQLEEKIPMSHFVKCLQII